ncbi:MAG: 2-amino-4-hydroxy-6-hydroxymethyldihydropteridine diphosphokinase [Nitrospinota bacterium]|nr:2-amino-4-hydroxy-6-hydroxymethyldihydropteridine diphosphokinase [Nitrospinota bacterium]
MKDGREIAFIGIGSNMGDPTANCLEAITRLEIVGDIEILSRSSLYKTAPIGSKEQDWFVNCVVGVATTLGPLPLLKKLMIIEDSMGRVRKEKWGERIIDLDILLYGDKIVREEGLTIPHPLMHERGFVLIPLEEIAPDVPHPVLNMSISLVADMVRDQKVVRIG